MWEKIKGLVQMHGTDAFLVAVVLLTGFLGFGLGKLSAIERTKSPVVFYETETATSSTVADRDVSTTEQEQKVTKVGNVVASKNGTKYYPSGCSGASRISEKNKISFNSEAAAIAAGYTKATTCK